MRSFSPRHSAQSWRPTATRLVLFSFEIGPSKGLGYPRAALERLEQQNKCEDKQIAKQICLTDKLEFVDAKTTDAFKHVPDLF